MEVSVRRAHQGDVAALVTLVREYCAADGHDFDAPTVRRGLEPLLEDDRHGVIWLAEPDDGPPVGYAVVTWGWSIEIGGLDVVLDEIFVRERGRGVGSRLIERLEADCRSRGVLRIFLETEAANEGARRLYRRHGYVADTSIWMAKEL